MYENKTKKELIEIIEGQQKVIAAQNQALGVIEAMEKTIVRMAIDETVRKMGGQSTSSGL